MNTPTRFKLPEEFSRKQLDDILSKRYAFLSETPQARSWRLYDTFDWRLFRQSLTLQGSDEKLVLRTFGDGEMRNSLPASSAPGFARDLPDSTFRDQLYAIVKERALLELATAHTWSCAYRILNKEEKTVARLTYIQVRKTASNKTAPFASFLILRPLRGYAGSAQRLAAYLQKKLMVATGNEGVALSVLRAAGHTPGAYSGKLTVHLAPDMPAAAATRLIFRQLLATMRTNEAGFKADIDSEFLHDYRIAVRKTRSALSQLPKVFPSKKTAHFKREFKALGKLTNNLRDLDVYLLTEADYRARLPEAMQNDIVPLFDYLRLHRADALAETITGLESKRYKRLLTQWETFINQKGVAKSAANASVPIVILARKRIYKQYRSIIQEGNAILKRPDDDLLHALRIECKKLRYLLEFFESLFPSQEIASMIKQLKRLQDNLGAFTDLAVQQAYLLSIAEALDIDEVQARRTLVATGFLVETMARRQQAVKADFSGIFRKFASPAHQKQFRKLFANRLGGK